MIFATLLVLKADVRPERVGANASVLCMQIGMRQERVVDGDRTRIYRGSCVMEKADLKMRLSMFHDGPKPAL